MPVTRKTSPVHRAVKTLQVGVDALRTAVDTLQRAVTRLESSDAQLGKTTETLERAIFGRWDTELNKQIPGIQIEISELRDSVVEMTRWQRIAGYIVVIPLFFVFAKAIGVPTEAIWNALGHLVH